MENQSSLMVDLVADSTYTMDVQFGTCGGNYNSAREDNGSVLRISLMIIGSGISLFGFIKSFITARKARENS